jgi:hypothetical protein
LVSYLKGSTQAEYVQKRILGEYLALRRRSNKKKGEVYNEEVCYV